MPKEKRKTLLNERRRPGDFLALVVVSLDQLRTMDCLRLFDFVPRFVADGHEGRVRRQCLAFPASKLAVGTPGFAEIQNSMIKFCICGCARAGRE